jgi:hypothetical protein
MKKTKRSASLLAALGAVAVLAGCQTTGSQVQDAKATFCSSMQALTTALQSVKALTPASTVEQAQTARSNLQSAWEGVTKSAENLAEVQLDATKQAYEEVSNTMTGISDQTTLAGAVGTLQASVVKFEAATTAINTTVCGVTP